MSKSEEMRRLAREGMAVADIARRVGVRYQFARNVLLAAGLLGNTRSNVSSTTGAIGGPPAPSERSATSSATDSREAAPWIEFTKSLHDYVQERIALLPELYVWPVPAYEGMAPIGANDAESTMSLRSQLSERWTNADATERRRIASFYVTNFGGIKSNAPGRVDEYADETVETTLRRGLKGIASWSKILAVRDPTNYAIYDARVGLQLNQIQIARLGHVAVGFPMLPSQNRAVNAAMIAIRPMVRAARLRTDKTEAYAHYLEALKSVAGDRRIDMVEMLLFADAVSQTDRRRLYVTRSPREETEGEASREAPLTEVSDRVVYLVSCVKTKQANAAPARELYTSDWFRSARAFVDGRSAPWFILSAQYGLVAPETVIAPYENTLKTQAIALRRRWARDVAAQLIATMPNLAEVVILAGDAYAEFLLPNLRAAGVQVVRPMLGLRQGEQLKWLKSQH